MSFQLEWIPTSYYNPVEDAVWHAEAGWEAYVPADSQDHEDDEDFFRVERIVLLMPQSDVAVRVGVEPFAAYIRAIEKTVRECFAPMSPIDGLDLVVQFEVWPSGKVEVGFAHYPGIANEVLEGLRRSLLALSTPTISQASIKFQIAYAIWGGSGASDRLWSSPAE